MDFRRIISRWWWTIIIAGIDMKLWAQEHLMNTFKHLVLYEALAWGR